jgi:hypothetical protein
MVPRIRIHPKMSWIRSTGSWMSLHSSIVSLHDFRLSIHNFIVSLHSFRVSFRVNVADWHHVDGDPGPAFYLVADPDSTFHFKVIL